LARIEDTLLVLGDCVLENDSLLLQDGLFQRVWLGGIAPITLSHIERKENGSLSETMLYFKLPSRTEMLHALTHSPNDKFYSNLFPTADPNTIRIPLFFLAGFLAISSGNFTIEYNKKTHRYAIHTHHNIAPYQ
jgi:hypothetical protein